MKTISQPRTLYSRHLKKSQQNHRYFFQTQLLIVIVLAYSSITLSAAKESFYLEAISDIKKYCSSCPEPSHERYIKALQALDKFAQISDKGLFYETAIEELLDAHLALATNLENENDEKIIATIDKLHQLALNRMHSTDEFSIIERLPSRIKMAFEKIKRNNSTSSSSVTQYLDLKFAEIKAENQKIIDNTPDAKKRPQVRYPLQPSAQAAAIAKKTIRRIKLGLISDKDIHLMNAYNDILEYTTSFSGHIDTVSKILTAYMESEKVSVSELNSFKTVAMKKIRRYSTFYRKYFVTAIWWSQAKDNRDPKGQLLFLKNQLQSNRRNQALTVLVSLGQAKIIAEQLKANQNPTFKLSLTLALTRAKMVNEQQGKQWSNTKSLIDEYSKSITNITNQQLVAKEHLEETEGKSPCQGGFHLQDKKRAATIQLCNHEAYEQHITWLMAQLAKGKAKHNSQQILKNLLTDNLFYNQQITANLTTSQKQTLRKKINQGYSVKENAQLIIDSNTSYHLTSKEF